MALEFTVELEVEGLVSNLISSYLKKNDKNKITRFRF